jgi:hypothetical protein
MTSRMLGLEAVSGAQELNKRGRHARRIQLRSFLMS